LSLRLLGIFKYGAFLLLAMVGETSINKDQKQLLLKEKNELKEEIKDNSKLTIIGIVLVILALIFGYVGHGLILISIELIVGIIMIVVGMSSRQARRIKEINYILAGDDAKELKTTHKVKKYYCTACDNEVKENDNKCKKCKNFLAADGTVKVKIIDIED